MGVVVGSGSMTSVDSDASDSPGSSDTACFFALFFLRRRTRIRRGAKLDSRVQRTPLPPPSSPSCAIRSKQNVSPWDAPNGILCCACCCSSAAFCALLRNSKTFEETGLAAVLRFPIDLRGSPRSGGRSPIALERRALSSPQRPTSRQHSC
ncbi:hypothetical protein QR680_007337 [Steinernema hermaphroditum]|uniref:Uncharacterized protein n=1 Tax=Steinernema hermaphroditum TaxID=289476 RepID=A0AA39IEB4_9BILA|nr:hypothetical protein QR680_007337 [Steinernema hermaphroditum]